MSISITLVPLTNGSLDGSQPYGGDSPNRAPVLDSPIPDKQYTDGNGVNDDLSIHFSDPDADTLTYTSPDSAFLASIGLTLTPAGVLTGTVGPVTGNTAVTVVATDPGALSAQDTFNIEVQAAIPPQAEWPRNWPNALGHACISGFARVWGEEPYRTYTGRSDFPMCQDRAVTDPVTFEALLDSVHAEFGDLTKCAMYIVSGEISKANPGTGNQKYNRYLKIIQGDAQDWIVTDGPTGRSITAKFNRGTEAEQFKLNETLLREVGGQNYANWLWDDWLTQAGASLAGKVSHFFMDVIPETAERGYLPTIGGTISGVNSQKSFNLNVTYGSGEMSSLASEVPAKRRALTITNAAGNRVSCRQISAASTSPDSVDVFSNMQNTVSSGDSFEITRDQTNFNRDYNGDGSNQGSSVYRTGIANFIIEQQNNFPNIPNALSCNAAGWAGAKADGFAPDYPHEFTGLWEFPLYENMSQDSGFQPSGTEYIVNSWKFWNTVFPGHEYIRTALKPEAQSSLGRCYVLWDVLSRQDSTIGQPNGILLPLDFSYLRFFWALCMLHDQAMFCPHMSRQKPCYIDESYVKLGNPIDAGGLLSSYDPVTHASTPRTPDGTGDIYKREFEEAIVVARVSQPASPYAPSHLGGQSTVTYTLPDPGAGKKWIHLGPTYTNPDTGWSTTNQDPSFNNGADATQAFLGDAEARLFLRVNA